MNDTGRDIIVLYSAKEDKVKKVDGGVTVGASGASIGANASVEYFQRQPWAASIAVAFNAFQDIAVDPCTYYFTLGVAEPAGDGTVKCMLTWQTNYRVDASTASVCHSSSKRVMWPSKGLLVSRRVIRLL